MAINLEGADEQDWTAYRELGSPLKVKSKIDDLVRDNGRYRDRHREDAERIAELEAQVPKDGKMKNGAVVLTKQEAAELEEFRKLGKPAEISSAISDGAQAKARLQAREKRDVVHEAARAMNWRPELAERIRGIDQAKIEIREVDVTDKDGRVSKGKVPFVTPSGEGAKEVTLSEYVRSNDPDLLDLLPTRPDGTQGDRGVPFAALADGSRAPRGEKLGEKAFAESVEKTATYVL